MFSLAMLFVILVFFNLFSIVITSFGEVRDLVYVLLVHLFVYFTRVEFYPFSLPHGVKGWLLLVIEALLGLFY